MFEEKRKSPRVPVSMSVNGSEAFDMLGFGYAHNISEEGLAIDAAAWMEEKKLPRKDSEIRMRFKLPKSSLVITVAGKVVRVDSSGDHPLIALSFTRLSPEFRSEIQNYVTAFSSG